MTETFQLRQNPNGQLVFSQGDQEVVDVRLRRSFPWTRPGEFISVRDSAGKEVFLIESLAALPSEVRATVERALGDSSFIPTIRRVDSINMDFGYQIWTVDTDRGPATFRVQEREDVRYLPDGRFSVKDVEGNVYVVPKLETMDEHSQRAMSVIV